MPVGPHILWPEKAIEVAIERLHVNRQVRHGLCAVEQHQAPRRRAALM